MSTAPVRAAMIPVSQRMRAYFAPITQPGAIPTLFDPGKYGLFLLDNPPAPWLDLGWIENLQRFCGTSTQPLRAGTQGAPPAQYRGPLDARIEFDFREWGKLQMALAAGSEHMNVLATNPNASPAPSGGTPIAAVPALAGSSASQIIVGSGQVALFAPGNIIAVDVDYAEQTGYVGSGISGAYVTSAASVNYDANYIRRITFNVARVAQVTTDALLLAQPLLGGNPASNASVQNVVAFVDREGGAFFQDWSALFIAEEESGGRACFHYPHLSPTTAIERFMRLGVNAENRAETAKVWNRETAGEIIKPLQTLALHAAFQALPHTDENDGQTILCYRSYYPAPQAALY